MTAAAARGMARAEKMAQFDGGLVDFLPNFLFTDSEITLRSPDEVGYLSFTPTEKCGVVMGNLDLGCYFIELPNVARNKAHNFEISPEAVFKLESAGVAFRGLWHSHPPLPSGVAGPIPGTDSSAGPWPSGIDLDYHPLHLDLYVVFEGVIRNFNVEGEVLDQWATSHEAG